MQYHITAHCTPTWVDSVLGIHAPLGHYCQLMHKGVRALQLAPIWALIGAPQLHEARRRLAAV